MWFFYFVKMWSMDEKVRKGYNCYCGKKGRPQKGEGSDGKEWYETADGVEQL